MTLVAYDSIRQQGYALAGDAADLQQRVHVYYLTYRDSGRRNIFPLIAAHGTHWAISYIQRGLWGGWLLSLAWLFAPAKRRAKWKSVVSFAEKFRNINRRVFAESYALYHYTKRFGDTGFIRSEIGDTFTDLLCECHEANATGSDFPRDKREALFSAFISWEQENIVAPFVVEAFDSLDWPIIDYLARKPVVNFAYFGRKFRMRFSDFACQDERVAEGLKASRCAEEVGLEFAEQGINGAAPQINARAGYCRAFLNKVW